MKELISQEENSSIQTGPELVETSLPDLIAFKDEDVDFYEKDPFYRFK